MATAQAFAVFWIEIGAVIATFDLVIGEHPVLWLSLGAAEAVLYGLASPTRSGNDALTP